MNTNIFDPAPIGTPEPDLVGELLTALDHIVLSVVKLDLNSGTARLLHSRGQTDRRGCTFEWGDFLHFYQMLIAAEEAEKLSAALSIQRLKELRSAGRIYDRVNLACRSETELDWLEVTVYLDQNTDTAYLLVRQSEDNYLLHRIIELYVYNSCDCFYYLDAENNCCTMFNGKEDTPLPPAVCTDYSEEIIRYAETYVVPEERDMVVREMSLDRVLSVLDEQEAHAFTFGMWDKKGNYTRKQMEYRYYNRERRMILLSRTDITMLYEQQQRHTRELEEALLRAQTDPLTGLWNYQGIQAAVSEALARSVRTSALLFLDLDNFKAINDTYGHTEGDNALQAVAEILKESIRPGDHAARVGGDEFVVFLSGLPSASAAADRARDICRRLEEVWPEDMAVRLSGSIGIAAAPQDGTDYETLVKNADRKAYLAKSNGKNQFVL
ncbi:MAG: GGDEF domain-containing protein [Lawsonibacter sp.]|jgi:diguanylate cyclase (GGDEF)-like protein